MAAQRVTELGVVAEPVDLKDAVATSAYVGSLGDIHTVVYAAGPHVPQQHLSRIAVADLARQLDEDVTSFFTLVTSVLPALRRSQGSLTAVTTAATSRYAVRDGLSAVPKAAIETLVRGLAAEEGRFGVRVNAVGPGMLTDGMAERLIASGDLDERALEAARANTPLRRFGTAADIANLGFGSISFEILQSLYDPVLAYDDKLQPVPGLMDKWAISEDGRTYTFHLRDGAKWTNGKPVTMDDIMWNLNRMIDLRGVSGSGGSFAFMEKENVKPLDKSTVQITLTQPYAPFLSALTCGYSCFVISPESATAQQGSDTIVTLAIGTGPYELLEYKPKDVLRLRKFKDNYRGIADGFDEIEIRNLNDDAVRINALRAGDVDFIILVPESEIDRLQNQEQDKIQTLIFPEGVFWWFAFNYTRPPFNDARVRKAAQLAHDAKQVADATTLGHGSAYQQPFPKDSPWHFDGVEVPQRDVEKAKQLLADAGMAGGLKARLLISTAWYASMGPASQVLQSQLAEAGITLEIENAEFGAYFDKAGKLDYDIIDTGWEVSPWDPDDYYFNCYSPKGTAWALQGGSYTTDLVNQLLDKGRAEPDLAKRRAIYQQLENSLQSDAAGIYSYRITAGWAWRTNLKGFKASVRGDLAHATGGIYNMTKA
jgi:ABC-type transport system substrate-binding protein